MEGGPGADAGVGVSLFSDIQSFVTTVRGAADLDAVEACLSDATRRLDFDYFGMVQRVSARLSVSPVQLSDFPEDWRNLLATEDYYVHDPVLVACEKSVAPFSWDDLPDLITMTRQHHDYMATAGRMGLRRGYTIPIHVPGEASGLCSFVTAGDRELPAQSLPAAQYLACFAFEAARRLVVSRAEANGVPRLTQRQLDCVVLVAQGKSNWVAGQLLGLSPQTVHKYLESAKTRYGVSSRTELVVRALYDGQLSFNDVLN
ncbi:LuxR family transcriptional regulator [Glacieibacterium frigidum]|uniref:LuxR family transcriptional regulator n=1 Tax=Glacieibacterium frigidum TaxID=2593303 RepID=A0A552UJC8_9SPHN|nr:LuxR family transcriptional regulator [Glacieibacterium frigidum]